MILKARGRNDRVTALGDCLDIGPPPGEDWEKRIEWLYETDPAPPDIGKDWMRDSAERFLADIRGHNGKRLVWIAPQSACEQCGVQWYFERFPEISAGPMIIADSPLPLGSRLAPPLTLGEVPDELMAELLDQAPRRNWPPERASPEVWKRLRDEDSLLRIVDGGELRSVGADHFDGLLMRQVPTAWMNWAKVVGSAMVAAGERGHNIAPSYLLWRLKKMIAAGRVACAGDLSGSENDRKNGSNTRVRRTA